MELKQLRLDNFRNYNELSVRFSPGLNLIIGDNAQGKTSLLEAINYLSLARSHRTFRDGELIHWAEQGFTIQADMHKKNGDLGIAIDYRNHKKSVYINRNRITKFSDLLGMVNTVVFTPEDLVLVKGGPSQRRRFLDQFISQISHSYFYYLQSYHKTIQHKNTSLKKGKLLGEEGDVLDVWNQQLIDHGTPLIIERYKMINNLNRLIQPIHNQFSGGKEELIVRYEPSIPVKKEEQINNNEVRDVFKQGLTKYQRLEKERKTSLIGPHRDDILFFINGKDVRTFGSQGQQRTAVLSLKIAQMELMQQVTGEYPLLLMDDVFSELDDHRRKNLLEYINNRVQTFITNTQIVNLDKLGILNHKQLLVKQGEIME